MNPYLEPPGFLGTGASLLADITLVAYLLLIIPLMLLGLVFARRNLHRPHHKWAMVLVTALNWVLIIFLMLAAYRIDVAPNLPEHPENTRYLLPAVHGLLGIPAQLLATFIVLRMFVEDAEVGRAKRRGERDTSRYWFRHAKSTMWITLVLWLATAALGVLSYLTRYNVIPAFNVNISVVAPLATDEVIVAPVATQELETTPEATAELQAPVATPEVTDSPAETLDPEAPAETPEVSAPVQTPEIAPPAETPEVSDDFRVEGTIEQLGSNAVIVDGQRYELTGARIDDVLRVGAFVRMEVHREGERLVVERIRLRDDD